MKKIETLSKDELVQVVTELEQNLGETLSCLANNIPDCGDEENVESSQKVYTDGAITHAKVSALIKEEVADDNKEVSKDLVERDWDKNFMFGHFGNGISICDLRSNSHIGHISDAGDLKWYEGANPPADVIDAAERFAKDNEAKYDERLEKAFAMKEDTSLAKYNKEYLIGKVYSRYLDLCSMADMEALKTSGCNTMEEKIRYLKEILKAKHRI